MEKHEVLITLHVKAGTREDFIREMLELGTADACRAEEGNLEYSFFLSVENPDEVLLKEAWESRDAQQAHMKTPHMAAYKLLKDKYILGAKMNLIKTLD